MTTTTTNTPQVLPNCDVRPISHSCHFPFSENDKQKYKRGAGEINTQTSKELLIASLSLIYTGLEFRHTFLAQNVLLSTRSSSVTG